MSSSSPSFEPVNHRRRFGRPRKLAGMPRQILELVTIAIVVMAGRSTLADHYTVPSGSMLPTVEEGDRIIVDKRAYGLRLPFTSWYMVEDEDPRPGDVVVLLSPETGIVLLKRVVAGPGDTVVVEGGQIVCNGEPWPVRPDGQGQVEIVGSHDSPGRTHPVQLSYDGGPDYGPVTLPPERFLVLGDNRGNSRDGRIFGLVDRGSILGRAGGVFFRRGSFTWQRL